MRLAFGLYSLGVAIFVWLVMVPLELVRIAAGRSTAPNLRAHLVGAAPSRRTKGTRLLIHAVSGGEMTAARALVAALGDERPDISVILTTGTQAGLLAAEASRATLPQIEQCTWLPWDRLRPLRRWLARLGPAGVVVIETEIWPNLHRACHLEGVPLFIASGRVYPADVARYSAASWFFRQVLGSVHWIGAQSPRDRAAFERIGAPADRVQVVGNLKFDVPVMRLPLPASLEQQLDRADAVIVAGSTHRPEERWLIAAFSRLRIDFPRLQLVIAPRDVDRASDVYRLVERSGLRPARWSQLAIEGIEWDVLIVDRFGMLPGLYEAADLVVMGGTFVPVGGHNLIEPAVHGRAIVAGPHVHHFREAAAELERVGGLLRVGSDGRAEESLYAACRTLLSNPARLKEMGTRGESYVRAQRGVARAYAAIIGQAVAGDMLTVSRGGIPPPPQTPAWSPPPRPGQHLPAPGAPPPRLQSG